MKLILPLEQLTPDLSEEVGGKAAALAELQTRGYPVPESLVIRGAAYRRYLDETQLGNHLLMELGRKDFAEMRWEELWDAALRIRNLFLKTSPSPALQAELAKEIIATFGNRPLAVRSSAPGEDGAVSSFAGLHDSFLNVCGIEQLLLAVRKVWASLWSDRALLYRRELGLDLAGSSMAVLVQALVPGDKSGVVFSRSPQDPQKLAIEAVPGLNQGLVDGRIEPDCWELDRANFASVSFRQRTRHAQVSPGNQGLTLTPVAAEKSDGPVLDLAELHEVARTALTLEQTLGRPQDIEWTWSAGHLILLQARPITTHVGDREDPRRWYLSLRRSLDNLEQLREEIETVVIPGMEAAARALATSDLTALTDRELAEQIERRRQIRRDWEAAYREVCIPMAHGIRLFGEFYNDAVQPEDPFEFVTLLQGSGLRAVVRNHRLVDWARRIAAEEELRQALTASTSELSREVSGELQDLADELGLDLTLTRRLLVTMAGLPPAATVAGRKTPAKDFLARFTGVDREQAERILAVGRAAYRLRDDDNISLDKVVREVVRAEREARRRLAEDASSPLKNLFPADPTETHAADHQPGDAGRQAARAFQARQLQGQPASPGLATAAARVVRNPADLAEFRAGEILVCDAIDPAMTFVVPLAAGIIERRGGMLIHGAIIAREYGIPCVSGIPSAADIITTGDRITVDGYLGLVFFPLASGKFASAAGEPSRRPDLDDAAE